ncbi:unnamed protein product, partial [Brassica oleracea]
GVEVEAEEEFQTLSEEEAEQASEVEQEYVHTQEEEELLSGDADADKDMAAGVVATRQSNRKRLAKPSISTAGSNKMRMASVLLSPRKRAAVKVGTRHGDSVVMFLLILNKTWNNNGFLSLWWFLGVYVKVLYYGEGLAFLVWHHGWVWWPITGSLFTVLNLLWCGKLVHVWLLRRWELKGIVGNRVNAFGFFALGITYGLLDQYKEHYLAFVQNGALYLLVAQIFLEHKYFLILIYSFDYLKWCWGNITQNIGSGLNGLNEWYFHVNGSAKKLYVYFRAIHKVGFTNCTYYGSIGILYVRILMIEKRNNGFQWCNGVPHRIDRISHKIDCDFTGFWNLEILRLLGTIKLQSSGSVEQYEQVYI